MKSKICKWCGKEFVIDKKERGRNSLYCSDECKHEAIKKQNRDRWKSCNSRDKILDRSNINRAEWIKNGIPSGFSYAGGFTEGNCPISIQHECGEIITNNIDSLRGHSKLLCPICDKKHEDWNIWVERLHQQKEINENTKKLESEFNKRKVKCVVCGNIFETYQPNQKTCSKKCSKKYRNYRNDRRLNKDNIIDRDITLATLYERDKGVCYICGCKCDWNDKEIYPNGSVKVGKSYPTIDHLIPLARGGKHSWNNIRLACHKCNSIKSDIVPNEIKSLIPDNAYILARKISTNRKQVEQVSKDGNLIAVFESTVDAENKTGIKQRGIQKCARGEVKHYGGYCWKYCHTPI